MPSSRPTAPARGPAPEPLPCAVCDAPSEPSEAPDYRQCPDCGARTSAVPAAALPAPGASPGDDRELRRTRAAERVQHLRDLLERAGAPDALTPAAWRILELGAGDGAFVDEALAAGFDAWGLDPDRAAIGAASSRAVSARLFAARADEPLPDGLTGPFDAVVSWELIEHAERPVEFLVDAARHLRPGGWLVGSTPNGASTWAELLGARWHGHHIPERHRVYLTPRAFEVAAARAGLEPVETRSTTEAGGTFLLKNVATAAAEGLAGTRAYVVRAGLAATLAIPEWLAERSAGKLPGLRGDTLLFVARKPVEPAPDGPAPDGPTPNGPPRA